MPPDAPARRRRQPSPLRRRRRPTPTPEGPHIPAVVLDPGHGGDEVGAANYGLVEKHSNLDLAFRIERLLQAEGVRVILTRREDTRVRIAARPRLHVRLHALRSASAHRHRQRRRGGFSSHSTPTARRAATRAASKYGSTPIGSSASKTALLAQTIQDNVLRELAAYGYSAVDRGIKDDTCFRERSGRCFPLFVLGPPRTTTRDELLRRGVNPDILGLEPGQQAITTRATNMPGALVELLFISNAADAAMLANEGARDAMARAVANALLSMLPPAAAQ